jgi:hypothetical protein
MADRREVASLPIKKTHVQALLRAGFRTVHDLKGTRISDLAVELNVSLVEAKEILDVSLPEHRASPSMSQGASSASQSASLTLGRTAQEMWA